MQANLTSFHMVSLFETWQAASTTWGGSSVFLTPGNWTVNFLDFHLRTMPSTTLSDLLAPPGSMNAAAFPSFEHRRCYRSTFWSSLRHEWVHFSCLVLGDGAGELLGTALWPAAWMRPTWHVHPLHEAATACCAQEPSLRLFKLGDHQQSAEMQKPCIK